MPAAGMPAGNQGAQLDGLRQRLFLLSLSSCRASCMKSTTNQYCHQHQIVRQGPLEQDPRCLTL